MTSAISKQRSATGSLSKKTHKTNMVRMDIAQDHARLGLTTSRGKRKLGHNDEPSDTLETVVMPAQVHPTMKIRALQ